MSDVVDMEALAATVAEIRAAGITSLSGIGRELSARGVKGPRGGTWCASQVSRLLERLESRTKKTGARKPKPAENTSSLAALIGAYRAMFGIAPAIQGLAGVGRDEELAELLRTAVRTGKVFDPQATAGAWERTMPPDPQ